MIKKHILSGVTVFLCALCFCLIIPGTVIARADTSTTDAVTVTTGFQTTADGKTYYYFADGTFATGWQTIDGNTYYFGKQGVMKTGIKKLSKKYYYFDPATGIMQTGWQTVNGNKYYFYPKGAKKGQAATGLVKIQKNRYYFSKKGVMQTGWKKIKGDKYFFIKKGSEKGQAATGLKKISGETYYFKKNGKLDTTTSTDAMDAKASDKESKTDYLILVNKSKHTVAIYKGSSKHWKRIKTYKCTIGASSTPTVEGSFEMGPDSGRAFHLYYFDAEGGVRVWYASRITGGTLFHSVLYWPADTLAASSVANGTLGGNLSHGCVRLATANAKWIYEHIPEKTKVIIY